MRKLNLSWRRILPLFALLLVFVPASVSESREIQVNEVCADGGPTCCKSPLSICFLDPDNPLMNYYTNPRGICTIVD